MDLSMIYYSVLSVLKIHDIGVLTSMETNFRKNLSHLNIRTQKGDGKGTMNATCLLPVSTPIHSLSLCTTNRLMKFHLFFSLSPSRLGVESSNNSVHILEIVFSSLIYSPVIIITRKKTVLCLPIRTNCVTSERFLTECD